jgi:hypothetical protein
MVMGLFIESIASGSSTAGRLKLASGKSEIATFSLNPIIASCISIDGRKKNTEIWIKSNIYADENLYFRR